MHNDRVIKSIKYHNKMILYTITSTEYECAAQ